MRNMRKILQQFSSFFEILFAECSLLLQRFFQQKEMSKKSAYNRFLLYDFSQ